ncbi:uncharacterized protein F4807DRAFT_371211 [Annulohypoxylon truncatum]|uniref:uncharacterized protein n=1 Tax=Annulohypoxylon truncatum TaxID=327061 RepID=UPI0020077174|nr:uncharacterized protein F4807DRAFT_371211 [Annulohypoxylon truncatum]KAI1212435.1 hypothetical protein F4807DRAFT_371211 [Annulohypoxylon truncatum]
MAKSSLPVIPRIVFGVVEPAMLVWAYKDSLENPTAFFAAQAPPFSADAVPPQALVLLLQLTNVYLLLAAVAVLCSWTSHASIAKWYLVAVALADYGHVHACYRGVGPDVFWDTSSWNAMLWGGVGVSAALNVLRWATLLGAFGRLRDPRGPPAPGARKTA